MNKFFIVSLFTLFCLVVCSTNIYAAEWPSDLPAITLPSPYDALDNEFVIYRDSANDIRLLFVSLDTRVTADHPYVDYFTDEDSSRISVNFRNASNYGNYILQNGSWSKVGSTSWSGSGGSALINSAVTEFIYSDYPITLSDGTVVFPVANPTLEETIQEETLNLHNKTIQTMKIIVLCGVGCLALLIGLKILPQILWKFLAR